jgi:hypothetical protein
VNWKVAAGVTAGLFGVGVAVGYAAQKRGIPQDKIGRWLLKETTRRVLRVTDAVRDALPDEPPKRLEDALAETPPGPRAG